MYTNPKTHRPHVHRSAAAMVAGGALSLGYATAAFAAPAAAAAAAAEAEAAATGEKRNVVAPVTVEAITADADADWAVLDVPKVTITPLHEQPDQIRKAKRLADDPEVVTTASAHLRVKANASAESLEVLAEGTELGTDADPVTKGDFTRVYTEDGVTGFVATRLLDDYVSPEEVAAAAAAQEAAAVREVTTSASASAPAAPASVSTIVAAARSQIGSAYAYGSAVPGAFDCSGLVSWAYAQVGISVPHSSSAIRAAGTVISASEAQPGDIIWSPGHVSIYIGGGQQIEAVSYGTPVQQSSIWQSSPVFLRF